MCHITSAFGDGVDSIGKMCRPPRDMSTCSQLRHRHSRFSNDAAAAAASAAAAAAAAAATTTTTTNAVMTMICIVNSGYGCLFEPIPAMPYIGCQLPRLCSVANFAVLMTGEGKMAWFRQLQL